jgi:hypothetical protein
MFHHFLLVKSAFPLGHSAGNSSAMPRQGPKLPLTSRPTLALYGDFHGRKFCNLQDGAPQLCLLIYK